MTHLSHVRKVVRSSLNRKAGVTELAKDVFFIERVFPKAQFASLLQEAEAQHDRALTSPVVNESNEASRDVVHRSSRSAALPMSSTKTVLAMQRVDHLAQILDAEDRLQLEHPTIVYYAGGSDERFGIHHDDCTISGSLEEKDLAFVETEPRCKWRKWTMFLYLTTAPAGAGGRTIFPLLGRVVTPRANCAVLFKNGDASDALRLDAVHEAEASDVDKIGMNLFLEALVRN